MLFRFFYTLGVHYFGIIHYTQPNRSLEDTVVVDIIVYSAAVPHIEFPMIKSQERDVSELS